MEVHDVTAALMLAAGKIPEVKSVGFDPTSPETSAAASFMIVAGGEENWRVTVERVDQRSENPTPDGRTLSHAPDGLANRGRSGGPGSESRLSGVQKA